MEGKTLNNNSLTARKIDWRQKMKTEKEQLRDWEELIPNINNFPTLEFEATCVVHWKSFLVAVFPIYKPEAKNPFRPKTTEIKYVPFLFVFDDDCDDDDEYSVHLLWGHKRTKVFDEEADAVLWCVSYAKELDAEWEDED